MAFFPVHIEDKSLSVFKVWGMCTFKLLNWNYFGINFWFFFGARCGTDPSVYFTHESSEPQVESFPSIPPSEDLKLSKRRGKGRKTPLKEKSMPSLLERAPEKSWEGLGSETSKLHILGHGFLVLGPRLSKQETCSQFEGSLPAASALLYPPEHTRAP